MKTNEEILREMGFVVKEYMGEKFWQPSHGENGYSADKQFIEDAMQKAREEEKKETAREILHWINKQNMKWVGTRETAELILLLQELEGEII